MSLKNTLKCFGKKRQNFFLQFQSKFLLFIQRFTIISFFFYTCKKMASVLSNTTLYLLKVKMSIPPVRILLFVPKLLFLHKLMLFIQNISLQLMMVNRKCQLCAGMFVVLFAPHDHSPAVLHHRSDSMVGFIQQLLFHTHFSTIWSCCCL